MAGTARFGGQRGGIQAEVLTESDIAEAAAAVTRRTGLARLTVKAVADELGITSPALYYHVAGRPALLDLVASHVVDTEFADQLDDRVEESWVDTLNRVLGMVTVLESTYPGVIPYLLGDATAAPASLRVSAFVVRQLRRGGFTGEQSACAYAAICALVSGWSLVDPGLNPPEGDGYDDLHEVFAAMSRIDAEKRLKVALNALLTGLEAHPPALD